MIGEYIHAQRCLVAPHLLPRSVTGRAEGQAASARPWTASSAPPPALRAAPEVMRRSVPRNLRCTAGSVLTSAATGAARLVGCGEHDSEARYRVPASHEGVHALARTVDRPAGLDTIWGPITSRGTGTEASQAMQHAYTALAPPSWRDSRFFRSRLVYCCAKRRDQLRRVMTQRVSSGAVAPMQIQREPARRSNLLLSVLCRCRPPRSVCCVYTCGAGENLCQVGHEYGAVVVARYRSTPSCDCSMSEVVSWESESQLRSGSRGRCAPLTPPLRDVSVV